MDAYISNEELPEGQSRCPKCGDLHAIDRHRVSGLALGNIDESMAATLASFYNKHGLEYETFQIKCPHCQSIYEIHGAKPSSVPTGKEPATGTDAFDFEGVKAALAADSIARRNEGVQMLLQSPVEAREAHKQELVPLMVGLVVNMNRARGEEDVWFDEHELRKAMSPFSDEVAVDILGRIRTLTNSGVGDPLQIEMLMQWLVARLSPAVAARAVPILKAYIKYVDRHGLALSFVTNRAVLAMAREKATSTSADAGANPWWKRIFSRQ
jgi:hypothetical protein